MKRNIPTVIIIGAGLGGLTLYHALIKNKDKKEFNVKIFERESGPKGIKIVKNRFFDFFSNLILRTSQSCHVTDFELFPSSIKKNTFFA